MNKQSANITINETATSFLEVESFETSSKGPGCLYMERKRTKANIRNCPVNKSIRIETKVKMVRAESLLMMLLKV